MNYRIHKIFPIVIATITLLLIANGGCKSGLKNLQSIKEGVITYNVEFVDIDPGGLMGTMMPKEIKEYFKESKVRVDFNIGKGIMKLIYIADSKTESIIYLFEVFGKKYAARYSEEHILKERATMPKFSFNFTKETKDIAGFKCKKVMITELENNTTTSIFYTKKVNADNPNWHTPFHDVDGFIFEYPVEYQLSKHKFNLKLYATAVDKSTLNDELFSIPSDHQIVSKEEIDEMIDDLMALTMN